MNRTEKPKKRTEFANHGEVSETDAAALRSATGRETSSSASSDIARTIGARPRSEVTGRHDAGSGANETVDGLTSSEESTSVIPVWPAQSASWAQFMPSLHRC